MFHEKYGLGLSDLQNDVINEQMKKIWGIAPVDWDNF